MGGLSNTHERSWVNFLVKTARQAEVGSCPVRDKSSLEKSTRLLEMSGGERLKNNRVCEDSGGGEAT